MNVVTLRENQLYATIIIDNKVLIRKPKILVLNERVMLKNLVINDKVIVIAWKS
jgi:hypothetical protein